MALSASPFALLNTKFKSSDAHEIAINVFALLEIGLEIHYFSRKKAPSEVKIYSNLKLQREQYLFADHKRIVTVNEVVGCS